MARQITHYKKPTLEIFTKHCERTGGNISAIAKSLNVERNTVYNWVEKDKDFESVLQATKESLLDFAESQLLNMVKGIPKLDETGKQIGWENEPNVACLLFMLKTQGKKRGYIERAELDHTTKGESLNKITSIEVIHTNENSSK